MTIFWIIILSFLFFILISYFFKPGNKKRYKYVFKKPSGELCQASFCIWDDEESKFNAHILARNYSNRYKYYLISIVDNEMPWEEIQSSKDVEWKTRSQMFNAQYDDKDK